MMTHTNTEKRIFSVSDINRWVRGMLEQTLNDIRIEGEISNLTHASSGHHYFTLKDNAAQLRCVFFKNRHHATMTPLQHGQHVVVTGCLSLYEARGDYQMIVHHLEDAGIGELYRAFELLKTKLMQAGLFDERRKKPIPTQPQTIGLITSPKGAALHDMMTTIQRRYPLANVKLYSSEVQGAQAAAQLIQALLLANQEQTCDVLILARGGGSLEDLWPFNHEGLAYAIAESQIPIVTGIGHETDFTIADFVADYRAATPTAAAEKVTPDWQKLLLSYQQLEERLYRAIRHYIHTQQQHITYLTQRLASPKRFVLSHQQTLDYLSKQLEQGILRIYEKKEQALKLLAHRLDVLSPLATLKRGYAIATHHGHVLHEAKQVKTGDQIQIRLLEGHLSCEVLEETQHD